LRTRQAANAHHFGAVFVLLIANAAGVYDTIELVSGYARLVEVSNFVLDVESMKQNLEEGIA